MVKLSSYSNNYDDGKFEDLPWYFWTAEEKSVVIRNAYADKTLNSKEIKPFLNASRTHAITQFVVPAAAAILYFGPLRTTLASSFFRRSQNIGIGGKISVISSWSRFCWINYSVLVKF